MIVTLAAACGQSHLTWPDVAGIAAFMLGMAAMIWAFLRWL